MSGFTDGLVWVVEYLGAKPCPVYAKQKGGFTTDIRFAEQFSSKEAAEAWMKRPDIIAFREPWTAVEHKLSIGV